MSNKLKNNGFTLIELAMVIMIGGILLGTLSSAILIYLKKTQINTTEQRLEKIDEAMQLFLSLNGRLPCPASLTDGVDTATFGVEIAPDCSTAGAVLGTTRLTTGRGGRIIRIGTVPTRSINLPDDYIADAWGQRFTYAVSEALASPGTYNRTEGAIFVVDTAGNSVITPAGSAHYVLISHGNNGFGATTLEGVAGLTCDNTTLEGENCNNDEVFRNSLLTSTANNANVFDDHVILRSNSVFGNEIPPGAVMAFNLNACPQGWTQFADATGRTIVGTGTYNESYNIPGRTGWSNNETYNLGDTGGFASWRENYNEGGVTAHPVPIDPNLIPGTITFAQMPTGGEPLPHENRPPYVALLYCERQ